MAKENIGRMRHRCNTHCHSGLATSASVPGGVNQDNGVPVLIQQGMFDVFSISSLAALCFSLTALIIFLAILTT
ncbi:hypothetical protein ACSBR2_032020 [Camellia fascicularis]